MPWQSARLWCSRYSQNCGGAVPRLSEVFRWKWARIIPRSPLKSEVFHSLAIPPGPQRREPNGPCPLFINLRGLRLTGYFWRLALDMLHGCGMMPESEELMLVGREVPGRSSSSVTAGALKDWWAASFPLSPPENRRVLAILPAEMKFPLVNLFGGTLRLNERLGCHDPFIEWAR